MPSISRSFAPQRLSAAFVAVLLAAVAVLAACGSSTDTPTAIPATSGIGTEVTVTLDVDAILDRFDVVTPEPVAPVAMTQAEARSALPFEYALPAWAPDGFVLQDDVDVVRTASGAGYASAIFTWLNSDEAVLHLQVSPSDGPHLGAAGASQAVTVSGTQALLVRGGSLGSRRLTLTWDRAGLSYSLSSEAGAAMDKVLVRMAESIP